METSYLHEHLKDPNNFKRFQQEALLYEVASLIDKAMKDRGITRSELAESLEVTKGRVSQYLGGERNLTLRTLADIFTALDLRLGLEVKDLYDDLEWQPATVDVVQLPARWNFIDKCTKDPADTQQYLAG